MTTIRYAEGRQINRVVGWLVGWEVTNKLTNQLPPKIWLNLNLFNQQRRSAVKMMSNQQYQSYLLRLWRNNADSTWHGSLQSTATGEKYTFADLGALWRFLVSELNAAGAVDNSADLATWLATQRIEKAASEQPTFLKETEQ